MRPYTICWRFQACTKMFLRENIALKFSKIANIKTRPLFERLFTTVFHAFSITAYPLLYICYAFCFRNCTSLHSVPVYPSATVPLTTRTSLPSSNFTRETTSQPTSKQTRSTTYTTITAKTRSVSDSSSSTKASTSSSATTPSPFIDKGKPIR